MTAKYLLEHTATILHKTFNFAKYNELFPVDINGKYPNKYTYQWKALFQMGEIEIKVGDGSKFLDESFACEEMRHLVERELIRLNCKDVIVRNIYNTHAGICYIYARPALAQYD